MVLVIGILIGVGLAHSNSDYVCSQAINDSQQGSCTGGSWSAWTNTGGTLQRTYTGTQTNVSFAGSVVTSCSHPTPNASGATGTTTVAYAACQIVETGENAGTNAGGSSNTNNGNAATTVTSQTETTGTVSSSTQTSGSYTDYQNIAEAALATSTITAAPSLVTAGNTTQISWTSDHVKSCIVTATNADTWTGLNSPDGGEVSSPIQAQTIYSLACTTATGSQLVNRVIVNIVPVFQER